jgi:hypothetical protein
VFGVRYLLLTEVGVGHRHGAELGMKRHSLQPSFRASADSLRQQAASTNLPTPSTPACGNGVYALALDEIAPRWCRVTEVATLG